MKQVNLTLTYGEEKLSALRRYMGKKELELETEMTDALTKLYEKYVPAPVREYIDENVEPASVAPRPRRTVRSTEEKNSELKPQAQSAETTEVS